MKTIVIENITCNIVQVHKDEIRAGDTIVMDGKLKTVCQNNIKHDSFMGTTIFGDSFMLGLKPVEKAVILTKRYNKDGSFEYKEAR